MSPALLNTTFQTNNSTEYNTAAKKGNGSSDPT